jgi:hypothetical protein
MVTTARTAMRSRHIPQLPKLEPLAWVVYNKLKVALGGKVDFDSYIDYQDVRQSPIIVRQSFLGERVKGKIKLQKELQTVDERYPLGEFYNH